MKSKDIISKEYDKDGVIRSKVLHIAAVIVFVGAVGFGGGWLGAKSYQNQGDKTSRATDLVLSESEIISQLAKKVGESVVSVNVLTSTSRQDIFGIDRPITLASAGTGFIIGTDGMIVTNRHVVSSDNSKISVILSDGTEFEDVEIIGLTRADDPLDVAFLKIKDTKGKNLKPVNLGKSSSVQVGDRVVAIGNALGQFQNTVTTGIISGYGRNIQAADEGGVDSLQGLFQTDAAINEGNSGGPLVNIHGQVIGVNTAKAGGADNIGFAIPIDDLKGLISGVLETGKLERPYLGVRYIDLNDGNAAELNLNVKRGAYIAPSDGGPPVILPGSPAERAGLKEEDIITKVNGEAVDERSSLVSLIGRHRVGEEIELTIIRDGKEQIIKANLEALPDF